MAVSPSALGVLVVTLLKMLTKTRKRVTNMAIRPGITSGGTRKEIHEVITNRPENRGHRVLPQPLLSDLGPCVLQLFKVL